MNVQSMLTPTDNSSTDTHKGSSISVGKVVLPLLLVVGVVTFFSFDLGEYFSLKALTSDQAMSFKESHSHKKSAIDDWWDGSPEGKAYSEFNHRLAGVAVLLIGLSELRSVLGMTLFAWARLLLPFAMLGTGAYLIIWSDHNAWPIGTISFVETFFGGDMLILQHKTYAILLLTVGGIELLRRVGWLHQNLFKWMLPTFAIIGGLLLFFHHHGTHLSGHQIALHHWIMGAMAITAGSCRVVSECSPLVASTQGETLRSGWRIAWSIIILLIGIELLLYSE